MRLRKTILRSHAKPFKRRPATQKRTEESIRPSCPCLVKFNKADIAENKNSHCEHLYQGSFFYLNCCNFEHYYIIVHSNCDTKDQGFIALSTAILLGAGSSLAAGFPSTQCLTDQVLSGQGVRRHTDASYYISDTEKPPAEELLVISSMARLLHAEAERYFSTYAERQANYEDLFYLARQVSDDLDGEMENPAVRRFVKSLRADMMPLTRIAKESGWHNVRSFQSLIRETHNYIADIVWRRLCREPACQSQLELIALACKSSTVTSVSTLCHDVHVETYLNEKDIPLSDGFSSPESGVRYWNGDLSSSGKTPFLKLHGSVNWFGLCPRDSSSGFDSRIGIPLDGDHYHTKTKDGEFQWPIDGRPLLLIGTFNKISQYSSGIFLDLYYQFRTTLSEADNIVICGYGFGDKGINAQLIDWYYDQRGRRVVIIHPDPDSLVAAARPAIRRIWVDVWQESNSISIIEKRFEDVGIDEFSEAIGN